MIHTCILKLIFSLSFFLAKFDRKDNGKTNAALPSMSRPIKIELTATDVPGLSLTDLHLSMSNASIPTYKKINVSARNDKVAKVCLSHVKCNQISIERYATKCFELSGVFILGSDS